MESIHSKECQDKVQYQRIFLVLLNHQGLNSAVFKSCKGVILYPTSIFHTKMNLGHQPS